MSKRKQTFTIKIFAVQTMEKEKVLAGWMFQLSEKKQQKSAKFTLLLHHGKEAVSSRKLANQ